MKPIGLFPTCSHLPSGGDSNYLLINKRTASDAYFHPDLEQVQLVHVENGHRNHDRGHDATGVQVGPAECYRRIVRDGAIWGWRRLVEIPNEFAQQKRLDNSVSGGFWKRELWILIGFCKWRILFMFYIDQN